MAITENRVESASAKFWKIGVRQVVYMALGAAIYAALSSVTIPLQIPGASHVQLRPAIVIPLFFGAVFGPWVGLFTGGVGNAITDLISGQLWWNWEIGNGLIGFVAGLAVFYTLGRYNKTNKIIIAEICGVLGNIVGLAFAAYLDIWVSKITLQSATATEFIPALIPNIIQGLILLPIVLVAYNAAVNRLGR
ncbi:ECF transporter S component [Ktedonosporobacter rubrisoli]|uniref:ECF transporter S component n=1 Tax=Ktedonosporobacter rubrisoli TaxID=2509675 RepID=A0A4P6K2J0_KTERU|nr:ECF transporter S component [Ktedonosporobacter rubrisoli]QBD82428.1 ECF transporter S component [Ktedonosporobacter rubrisoli]